MKNQRIVECAIILMVLCPEPYQTALRLGITDELTQKSQVGLRTLIGSLSFSAIQVT